MTAYPRVRAFDGLWYAVGLALVGQGLDLATALLAFRFATAGHEGNPLMAAVYAQDGPLGLLLAKGGVALLALGLLWLYLRRPAAERGWGRVGLLMVALAGIVGAATNTAGLLGW